MTIAKMVHEAGECGGMVLMHDCLMVAITKESARAPDLHRALATLYTKCFYTCLPYLGLTTPLILTVGTEDFCFKTTNAITLIFVF
jgi:hypothetical protein